MSKNILKIEDIPANYEDNFIGKSYFSKCYKINNKVFKKYLYDQYLNWYSIEKLMGLEYEGFTFPEKFLSDKGNIIGHITNYVEGEVLLTGFKKLDLETYQRMNLELQNNVAELTKNNIYVEDMVAKNIIITPNQSLEVIDTDNYIINKNISHIYNIILQNICITRLLIEDTYMDNVLPYNTFEKCKIEGKDINEYVNLALYDGIIDSNTYLNILRLYAEKTLEFKLNTVQELRGALRMLKK